MKVSFLILTFVLILATNISAKRFDDDNYGNRKSRLRGGDANVNIKVGGRKNSNPKDEYRCTTAIDNTDGFDCSIPQNHLSAIQMKIDASKNMGQIQNVLSIHVVTQKMVSTIL